MIDGKKQRAKKFEGKTFARADSAYCKQDVIKVLVERGVLFTLMAHQQTTHWKDLLDSEGLSWTPWKYSEEEQLKAANRGKELPEVDLARLHWTPGWSKKDDNKLVFPIIVKRTLNKEKFEEIRKKNNQLRLLNSDGYMKEDPYDYYAIVCNFPLDLATDKVQKTEEEKTFKRYSLQEVMAFHQKRGNMENFIREEKYSYDLKHFPCQKLNANRAYGLLAQVAHNMLRYVSILMRPEKPHFSKKLRKRFIFHAGKVVKTARQLFLKITEAGYEEVMKLREAWGLAPARIPLRHSSA